MSPFRSRNLRQHRTTKAKSTHWAFEIGAMTDDDDGRLPDTDPLEEDFETKDWSVEAPEK